MKRSISARAEGEPKNREQHGLRQTPTGRGRSLHADHHVANLTSQERGLGSGMPTSYRSYEPDQVMLLPAAPQDWLPPGHLAYFIHDTIDALDLRGRLSPRARWAAAGVGVGPVTEAR